MELCVYVDVDVVVVVDDDDDAAVLVLFLVIVVGQRYWCCCSFRAATGRYLKHRKHCRALNQTRIYLGKGPRCMNEFRQHSQDTAALQRPVGGWYKS